MIELSRNAITLFDDETPRRDAFRSVGVAGAALLSVIGLGALTPEKVKSRSAWAEKKRKRKTCKCPLIGLTSSESEPFSLDAGTGVTKKAVCPDGFIAISGGLQGASEVTAPCMIRESRVEPDGSAWAINVFCTEATNTELIVGAICFSRNSFQLQEQPGERAWLKPGDG